MIPTFTEDGRSRGIEVHLEQIAFAVPGNFAGDMHPVHLVQSAGGCDVWVRNKDTQEPNQESGP